MLLKSLILGLIMAYRKTLGIRRWFLPPLCRFYPSCSEYGYQAIEQHGLIKGLSMTVRRLAKCHPFHPGGLDPVPAKPNRESFYS